MAEQTNSSPAKSAVVVGGGLAGLVSAWELVRHGCQVSLIEARGEVGGSVVAHELGGLLLDAGAESYVQRSSTLAELAAELGLGEQLTEVEPVGSWLYCSSGSLGHARRLPRHSWMGVPGAWHDESLKALLGVVGYWRARADTVLPGWWGGRARSLADAVRARMGRNVVDRLVDPILGGVYSWGADELDVQSFFPELRATLREFGGLAALVQRRGTPQPLGGLRGGMFQLTRALKEQLVESGVEILVDTRVDALRRVGSLWRVSTAIVQKEVHHVVIATEAAQALALLKPHIPAIKTLGDMSGRELNLVTLLVDQPELDAAPRGTGIIVQQRGMEQVQAKALTHATAKWSWLAEDAGPGTHVLRLSYGPGKTSTVDQALRDASTLMGLAIGAQDVVDADHVRWHSTVPPALLGQREKIGLFRQAVASCEGIGATGAWLAGSGIIPVIEDAKNSVDLLLGGCAK